MRERLQATQHHELQEAQELVPARTLLKPRETLDENQPPHPILKNHHLVNEVIVVPNSAALTPSTTYVGRSVLKEFDGYGVFSGKVTEFSLQSGLFTVVYEDGDVEEVSKEELEAILVKVAVSAEDPEPPERSLGGTIKPKSGESINSEHSKNEPDPGPRGNDGGTEISAWAPSSSLVGRSVLKEFDGYGVFSGKVTEFSLQSGLFTLVYEDGDEEEVSKEELEVILVESSQGGSASQPVTPSSEQSYAKDAVSDYGNDDTAGDVSHVANAEKRAVAEEAKKALAREEARRAEEATALESKSRETENGKGSQQGESSEYSDDEFHDDDDESEAGHSEAGEEDLITAQHEGNSAEAALISTAYSEDDFEADHSESDGDY